MGKWIAAVVAVLVLGGGAFAVYKLTNIPEQAQEWWDEKKLDNFETLANREIADFEGKIEALEKTQFKNEVQRKAWAGDKVLGDNNFEKQALTGSRTLMGLNDLIALRTKQGEVLASAYKAKAKEGGANIADGSTDLKADVLITVELPMKDGSKDAREMKAGDIMTQLGNIENELQILEIEQKGAAEMVAEYDKLIGDIDAQVKAMKASLDDMRKQVGVIAAQIRVQKAKEDLAELNKSIRGQGGKSELGDMIAKYQQRKSKFQLEELVSAEKKADTKVSLSDLDKPSGTTSAKTSRFMK
ncbi:MAG: hypothetical protein IT462_02820 [Planctomycetes bacterium]|nr:hypothetical protein [Planctomycetota bacterium]